MPQSLKVELKALPPPSQVRGAVRSFGGSGLVAHVRLEPSGLETTTLESGEFSLDVPPGDYEVLIEADGYESQRRKITVEPRGVRDPERRPHEETMMLFARVSVPRRALAVATALLACLLAAILLRREHGVIATLDGAAGSVERDRHGTVGKWKRAAAGAEFVFGDGVKTDRGSQASLTLFDRSRLVLDPSTLVRFLGKRSGSKAARVDVQMGGVTLEAGSAELDVDSALGAVHLAPQSKVRVLRDNDRLRLEVTIGSARLLDLREMLELTVGKAVDILPDRSVRPVEPSASPSALPGMETSAAPSAGAPSPPSDALPVAPSGGRQRGPEEVDFSAKAGESFVLHTGRPPAAVALTQVDCPGAALLVLSSRGGARETAGDRRVSASVPAGTHHYAVSCLDENDRPGHPVAEGAITVVADAGTRTLAKTAPDSSVETDGRRYTILDQSLLPRVTVKWPNAPEASGYTLTVRSSSNARTVKSKGPSYTLAAGALGEGEHSFVFEASGKRSKVTTVAIRFDNAAPTASLSSPTEEDLLPAPAWILRGRRSRDGTFRSKARSCPGRSTSLLGRRSLPPSEQRGLLIRFANPQRGTHYYLRRAAH